MCTRQFPKPSAPAQRLLTLQDRPLIAAVVNAIKEPSAKLTRSRRSCRVSPSASLQKNLCSSAPWATTSHSITSFASAMAPPTRVRSVSPSSQVAAILAATAQSGLSASPASPTGLQAPVIELNGNASSRSKSATHTTISARASSRQHPTSISASPQCLTVQPRRLSRSTPPRQASTPFSIPSPRPPPASPAASCAPSSSLFAEHPPAAPANDNPFNAEPANDNASTTVPLAI